ncbi:MAG TPA: 30S ribosomal protein S19e [Candidatus Altiarchaeales archaeon]|nr:30S ribosomal protein S19e [Candidatus Altiarchaeales archaeon]
MNITDIPADKLINAIAQDLRENQGFEKPEWAGYVKTGASRERQPDDANWWWMRAASMLRKITLNGPVGVERLRFDYGGKKDMGRSPAVFRKSGGKVIRTILQQLDASGLCDKTPKGRVLTPKGQSYISGIAKKISQ